MSSSNWIAIGSRSDPQEKIFAEELRTSRSKIYHSIVRYGTEFIDSLTIRQAVSQLAGMPWTDVIAPDGRSRTDNITNASPWIRNRFYIYSAYTISRRTAYVCPVRSTLSQVTTYRTEYSVFRIIRYSARDDEARLLFTHARDLSPQVIDIETSSGDIPTEESNSSDVPEALTLTIARNRISLSVPSWDLYII